MGKKVLELQTSYIADVVIDVKRKKFGEDFVSLKDCFLIKKIVQQRLKRKGFVVNFVDVFFEDFFVIKNGVITKSGDSSKKCISDGEVRNLIYDEQFIL